MLKLIPPDGKKYKCYYIRGTIAKGRRIFESTGTAKRREAELIFEKKQKDWLNGKLDLHVKSFADAWVDYIEDINPGQSQREAVIGADNKDGSLRPCLLTYFGRVEDCRESIRIWSGRSSGNTSRSTATANRTALARLSAS